MKILEEKELKILEQFLSAIEYVRLENTSIWKLILVYEFNNKTYTDSVIVDTEDLSKHSLSDAMLIAIDKKQSATNMLENSMRYEVVFGNKQGTVSEDGIVSDKDIDCPTCPQTMYSKEL